jgi:hemerythrin superfamily protein
LLLALFTVTKRMSGCSAAIRIACASLRSFFAAWQVRAQPLRVNWRQSMARKFSKASGKKVERAMHEMKQATLKSGRSGRTVRSRQQAIAIGLSEARQAGERVPKKIRKGHPPKTPRLLKTPRRRLPRDGLSHFAPAMPSASIPIQTYGRDVETCSMQYAYGLFWNGEQRGSDMSPKSTITQATKSVAKVFSSDSKAARDADILNTLKEEHEEVKSLLSALQRAESAKERSQLVQSIKQALVPHTKAEETVVYDAIMATAEEEAETDGLEGYLEHEWASKTLQRLEQAGPTSAEHKAAANVLKDLVEHHIEEEESNVWRDVRKHFDVEARVQMNRAFETAKQKVKVS